MNLAHGALLRAGRLTTAEQHVALLALEGRDNAEIAIVRGSSVHTVANLLARAYRKMRVSCRAELAATVFAPAENRDTRRSGRLQDHLSPREHEVVARAGMGHANKRIAYDLGISATTVASYLCRASKKLGVTSRVALVRVYGENAT